MKESEMKNKDVPYKLGVTLLYSMIMIISSCTQPFNDDGLVYDDIETDSTVAHLEESELYRTESPSEEEEIKQEITEERMELKPIADYEAYGFSDGKLIGISGKNTERIVVSDTDDNVINVSDFYRKNGDLFFNVVVKENGNAIPDTDPVQYELVDVTYYFKQSNGIMTEITGSEFVKPAQQRVTMNEGLFKIEDFQYKGSVISAVYQGSPYKTFLTVDGYLLNKSGLWFSIPEGVKGAERGLYFSEKVNDGNSRFPKVGEYVRLW
jgi:hypothetical protein